MTSGNMEAKDWAFSESEYRGRVARAKEALKEAGLDCAVCVGPELINYYGRIRRPYVLPVPGPGLRAR